MQTLQSSALRLTAPRIRIHFPNPVLAGLEKVGGDGLKNLDVRRQRSWLVSRFSGSFSFFKEPRSGPDCGSPFLLLTLLLAKQKKSELPPGNPRHTQPSNVKRYKFKSYSRPNPLACNPKYPKIKQESNSSLQKLPLSPQPSKNMPLS